MGLAAAGNCLTSRPDLPVRIHLVPRETTDRTSTSTTAVVADGCTNSFEIHIAFAHDGPAAGPGGLGDRGDDSENAADDEWVTIYAAGWDRLDAGGLFSAWGAVDEPWGFDLPSHIAPDFNQIPATLLYRYQVNARTKELK